MSRSKGSAHQQHLAALHERAGLDPVEIETGRHNVSPVVAAGGCDFASVLPVRGEPELDANGALAASFGDGFLVAGPSNVFKCSW